MLNENEMDRCKMVCINCHYMQRAHGRNSNDDFYCNYYKILKKNIQINSCEKWKEQKVDNLI